MSAFTDYADYDATALAALIRDGQVSAAEALEAAIARADAVEPSLNAVPLRLDAAARRALGDGAPDGPFGGVPFLLKNLFAFLEGAPLSNGSRLFQGFVADTDNTYVSRCRAAGLVTFGLSNSPEFGVNITTEPVVHGPTRNPWDLELSPGGSSGGAAAAVAAGIVPMAHATDGGGSIRIPAANCGLFGLKPSRGRNPMGPVVGEAWNGLATGHAVSRTVRDSARLLDATHGPAPGDPYAAPAPERPYAEEVGRAPGRLRIGLWTEAVPDLPLDPACRAATEVAARLCEELGHVVEPVAPPVDTRALGTATGTVIAVNTAALLDQIGRTRGRPVAADEVERGTWAIAAQGRGVSGPDYAETITTLHRLGRALGQFFEDHDVLLSPTLSAPPPRLGEIDQNGPDPQEFLDRLVPYVAFTRLYNVTGCPAMSVPLHWTEGGLPVGTMFGARYGEEAMLFRLAAQIEAARPWRDRRPPI